MRKLRTSQNLALIVFACLPASFALAQDVAHCVGIKDADDRLNCFDQAFIEEKQVVAPSKSDWEVTEDKSKLDDSRSVRMISLSTEAISDRLNQPVYAALILRCQENTTNALLFFGGNFMSDIQGYGRVDYRIDDQTPQTKNMSTSSSNEALGLWNGGSAIPFIKQLFGGDSLYVRATPYNQSPIEMNFRISQTEQAVAPLRDACGW